MGCLVVVLFSFVCWCFFGVDGLWFDFDFGVWFNSRLRL